MLLVDDEQTQVAESDVLCKQRVGADDNVDLALLELLLDGPALLRRLKARQTGRAHGKIRKARGERVVMLLGEDGCRREDGDLLAVHHGLEGGAERNLGFAVAHVAAEQTVHGPGPLHVGLDLPDALELVGRFRIGKALLQLHLPGAVL